MALYTEWVGNELESQRVRLALIDCWAPYVSYLFNEQKEIFEMVKIRHYYKPTETIKFLVDWMARKEIP